MNSLTKPSIGFKFIARSIAKRAQKQIPGYQKFLEQQGVHHATRFEELPISDKNSYLHSYPFSELTCDRFDKSLGLFRSSGASGQPFYWPMLKSTNRFAILASKFFLEKTFKIHRKKTLIIIASSLGSWLGGEHFSWAVKSVAAQSSYPLTIFSPGSNLEEIAEIIEQFSYLFEQIIILINPSLISILQYKAIELNLILPLAKIKYIVIAEYFPESLRTIFRNRAELPINDVFMVSMYGSTDTGGIGVESPASIAVRQLLAQNPDLGHTLGFDLPLPIFAHSLMLDGYLEHVEGKFCITRWQGIPLVRYNLADQVTFYNWRSLKQAVLNTNLVDKNHPLIPIIAAASNFLPDIVAISGRADKTVIIGGTNLTESMLDAAVKSESLSNILTGLYQAKVLYQDDHSQLIFDLELRQNQYNNPQIRDYIYSEIINTLIRVQPEFSIDWNNIYKSLENDAQRRIIQINLLTWPTLSALREKTIKQTGLYEL